MKNSRSCANIAIINLDTLVIPNKELQCLHLISLYLKMLTAIDTNSKYEKLLLHLTHFFIIIPPHDISCIFDGLRYIKSKRFVKLNSFHIFGENI